MSIPTYPLLRRHFIAQSVFLFLSAVCLFLLVTASGLSVSLIAVFAIGVGVLSSIAAVVLIRFVEYRRVFLNKLLDAIARGESNVPSFPGSDPDTELRASLVALKSYTQQQQQHDQTLIEALSDIGGHTNIDDMLRAIAERAKQLTKAKYTALATFHKDNSIDKFITLGMTQAQERGISRLPEGKGLLGHIHKIRQPIMTANLNKHPQSVGFPEGHPPMTSLLAVPILSGNSSLGNLYVTDKIGAEEFSEQDKQSLLLLAQISAILLSRRHGEEELEILVTQVTDGVAVSAVTTERISDSVESILKAMRGHSSQTAGVAAATEKMSATINDNMHTTSGVVDRVKAAGDSAKESSTVIARTIDTMNNIGHVIQETNTAVAELTQGSSKIGDIVAIISDIASQTNLLALNAAIEAARAGTAGRGFAVVADEVKKLSDRTAHEIRTIKDTVAVIQSQTLKTHESMQRATDQVEQMQSMANAAEKALSQITAHLQQVTEGIVSVAAASKEQAHTSNTITGSIEELNGVAEQTTKQLESIALAVEELNRELNTWTQQSNTVRKQYT